MSKEDEVLNAVDADLAEMIGEEMGVEPESIQVPPGVLRGVLVYELENGAFGYRNLSGGSSKLDISDAISLGQRLVAGATADLISIRVVEMLQRSQRPAEPKSGLVVPRSMGRRSQ